MDDLLLRGAKRFRKLVEDAGGFVSSGWVAELLEIMEKDVTALLLRNALIARRPDSGEASFPRFQFDETKGQVLAGLQAVLVETESWAPDVSGSAKLTHYCQLKIDPPD